MRRLALVACVALTAPVALAAEAGWTDLFNGKDLTGWVNQGDNWRVIQQDAEPVLECFKGGGSLTCQKPYGDAILDLWFRLPRDQNSGIFFRGSKIVPGGYPPPGSSYEVQLYDHKERWGHRTGDLLYPHRARRWASRPAQWNHCTIISLGRHHKCYLNGQCVFDVIDSGGTPEKGYISLQAHGGKVYFKRVRIKEITDGRWPEQTGRLKALLFVGESRGIGKRCDLHGALIEKFLDDTGRFEITWSPEELALEPQYLSYYDLIILYDNRPSLSPKAQKQIEDFVRNSGGLVVLNRSCVGTFKTWSEFEKIVAAPQPKANWTGVEDIEVQLRSTWHPILAGVKPFRVRDDRPRGLEIPVGDLPRWAALATCGPRDERVAWVLPYGKGKVFACVLGQEQATLGDPNFQRMVANAAAWVALPPLSHQANLLLGRKDVAGLAKLLHEPPTREDWPVVEAIAHVGTRAAADALAAVASSGGEPLIRMAAASGLGRVREGGLDALHSLVLSAKPESMRLAAADALGARADAKSAEPLTKALDDASELVREKALAALGRIGTPQAEKTILARLKGDDPWWYEVALATLGRADSDRARKALLEIATKRAAKYRSVLPAVAKALAAQMKHAEVFDALAALLDAPEREARLTAARALATSKDPRVHDLFLPRVFGRDPHVGRIAEDYIRAAGKTDLARFMSPFIRQWMIIGPFPNEGNRGLKTAYPPEKESKLDAAYDGVGGRVRWQRAAADGDTINLAKLFPKHNQNVVAYACVAIESPDEREVQLRTGSDDGIAAWLNGRRILFVDRPRSLTVDEDRTPIRLRRGENRLLLKIAQGTGDWAFCARLADPKGNLAGLKWRLPQ